jgi:FKBP-type peptidyl-prolyl cis-trans isomerase FkpA
MKRNLMLLALAAIGLASCNSGQKKGEGGLLYEMHEDKDGAAIKDSDFVSINLIVKTDADSVMANSYDNGMPFTFPVPKPQFKGDFQSGLNLLSEGDSATIKVNLDSIAKASGKPKDLKGKYVVYEVKVVKVISKGKLTQPVFQGRVEEYFKAEAAKMKNAEPGKIAKYIASHNIKATKTATGLNYQITKPGNGPIIGKGDTAVVNYAVKLLSDKVFDTNIKSEAQKAKIDNPMRPYTPMRVPVGVGAFIAGWDQGLQLLNKGAKATLVIPSSLAYGERGFQQVAPYTPIVFEIELVDIVHPNPNAPKPAVPQGPAMQPAPQQ